MTKTTYHRLSLGDVMEVEIKYIAALLHGGGGKTTEFCIFTHGVCDVGKVDDGCKLSLQRTHIPGQAKSIFVRRCELLPGMS